ncbi:hypothetical protein JD969_07745 [Planctomycetota bacterium]|nr:hypothetical protein JD969_07745 [Planctomycetota bacterium]
MTTTAHTTFFAAVADAIAPNSQFASIVASDVTLNCEAPHDVPALYQIIIEADNIYVVLSTPDRWLSESVEADLMHTGDKLEELLEDELVELGSSQTQYNFEHFRDDEKCYIFRTPIAFSSESDLNNASLIKQVADLLLAYQLAFVELGDMTGEDED